MGLLKLACPKKFSGFKRIFEEGVVVYSGPCVPSLFNPAGYQKTREIPHLVMFNTICKESLEQFKICVVHELIHAYTDIRYPWMAAKKTKLPFEKRIDFHAERILKQSGSWEEMMKWMVSLPGCEFVFSNFNWKMKNSSGQPHFEWLLEYVKTLGAEEGRNLGIYNICILCGQKYVRKYFSTQCLNCLPTNPGFPNAKAGL
jgi:hypothetical protein